MAAAAGGPAESGGGGSGTTQGIAGSLALPSEQLQQLAPAIHAQQQSNEFFKVLRQIQEEAAGRIGDELGVQPAWTDLTDDNGCAVFASADGSTQFLVQAYEGLSKEPQTEDGLPNPGVFWMVKPISVIGTFAVGGRLNVFLDEATYAPNLDIELYHYPMAGKLFVYANLVPRRSLVDNPGDLDRFYLTPPAEGIAPLHDLYLACEADARWEPFRTKSAYVRALTGGTCLMYQIEASSEGVAAVAKLVRRVVDCWLAHAIDREAPAPLSEGDAAALEATGRRLLNYVRLDPDNKKAAAFIGVGALDKMLSILSCDNA